MTAVNLIFKPTPVRIDVLTVDASVSEQHGAEVEITEHPVESGANIADHARAKPVQLTLECIVSNDPIPDPSVEVSFQEHAGQQFVSRSETTADRAGRMYRDLLELKDAARLITVDTSLATYDNMMLKSLSVPRTAQSGQALHFTATFGEIRVVSSETVVLEEKAKPKKPKGKVPTSEVPPERSVSALKGIYNIGVDTVKAIGGR